MSSEGLRIDLSRFGIRRTIRLEGVLVEELVSSSAPLLFLWDENHDYLPGIHQSLRNTLHLIDAGIVDFVGVEGLSGNAHSEVNRLRQRSGFPSVEEAGRRFRNWNVPEASMIRSADSFTKVLVVLRPQTAIYGVEDPAAYEKAGTEIELWMNSWGKRVFRAWFQRRIPRKEDPSKKTADPTPFAPDRDPSKPRAEFLSEPELERLQFIRTTVRGDRPRFFLENLIRYRKETGSTVASVLNAGRLEQDEVCRLLRRHERFSFLRVRPRGYPGGSLAAGDVD